MDALPSAGSENRGERRGPTSCAIRSAVERLPPVTVVCPVFNQAETVPLFYERLMKSLAECDGKVRFELLFVNNRSTDRTLDVIRALREKDERINWLTMSRNYGYQASIT